MPPARSPVSRTAFPRKRHCTVAGGTAGSSPRSARRRPAAPPPAADLSRAGIRPAAIRAADQHEDSRPPPGGRGPGGPRRDGTARRATRQAPPIPGSSHAAHLAPPPSSTPVRAWAKGVATGMSAVRPCPYARGDLGRLQGVVRACATSTATPSTTLRATSTATSSATRALLSRVKTPTSENFWGPRRVMPGMREITDAHVAEPGLAVVEVAAADDATALAVYKLLAARCAITPADGTTREPASPAYSCASPWTCIRNPARRTAGRPPPPADQPWSGSWSGLAAAWSAPWSGWPSEG